jgi:hypothetical protein
MEDTINNIEIPVVSDTTYTLTPTADPGVNNGLPFGTNPFGWMWSTPGVYGGGTANTPNVWDSTPTPGMCACSDPGCHTWGWPEDCCSGDLRCTRGAGAYGTFELGVNPGLGTIWIEDVKTGADKTAYFQAENAPWGTDFNVWVDATGSVDRWYSYRSASTGILGNWNIGDIIHIPGGTLITDSWNASFGGSNSLAMDIVIQLDWLTVHYDTTPLLIPIDKIITVVPDTTTTVKIVASIPSVTGSDQSIFTIINDTAAPTPMSLVHCINRAIKHGGQRPGTNTLVDWNYTHVPNITTLEYNLDLNATP